MFARIARKLWRASATTVEPRPEPAPFTCFLSHDYRDGDVLAQVLLRLPKHIRRVIFPPIRPSPQEFVSDELVKAISRADALAYLVGGHSGTSPWVNFERRYAARIGKPVYALSPTTATLTPDDDKPHNTLLTLKPIYGATDSDRVNRILNWLHEHRNVHSVGIHLREPGGQFSERKWTQDRAALNAAVDDFKRTGDSGDVHADMRSFVKASYLGGVMVLFLSNEACARPWPSADEFIDAHRSINPRNTGMRAPKRAPVEAFQFVWLDKPDKTKIEAGFARVGERVDNNKFREMIWESLLHLSEGEGFLLDHEGNLNANRLDDLLVGLEHAAHWKKMKDLDAKIEHQEEERRRKDKEYSRWEQRERMWDMEYRRKR